MYITCSCVLLYIFDAQAPGVIYYSHNDDIYRPIPVLKKFRSIHSFS